MSTQTSEPPSVAAASTAPARGTASARGVGPRAGDPKRPRAATRSRQTVLIIGSAIIVASLAVAVGLFGQVNGREFAPSHFEIREFSFVEIPILELQITPIRRTTQYSRIGSYLSTAAIVPRPQGTPQEWHLIEIRRPATGPTQADAKLLSDFLEHNTTGTAGWDLYWHKWSMDHPQAAAVLWPEVQKLAQRELYVLIPDLFRIADVHTDAQSLGTEINGFLATSYERLIADMRAAGRSDLAESLRAEAMADYPDDPRWQQLP